MTIQTTLAYDAISANVGSLPHGAQVAGYSTGSGIVPWTAAQWAAHPGAIRIDQDPSASDATADVLDVETGAATVADVPGWVTRARAARAKNTRPGQRAPAVYVNESNIHAVANALTAAKITGVPLWVANWNLTQADATAMVQNASGPFPVVGVQYHSGPTFDTSVFSVPWLHAVSGAKPPPAKGPHRNIVPSGYGKSLWRVAQDRHVSEQSLIDLSHANLNATNRAMFDDYLALEASSLKATGVRAAMNQGLVFYTANEWKP